MKKNCWEATKCGKQSGGAKSDETGVCPVATADTFDGVHGGLNAGRACWVVSGSLCRGTVQGPFALKFGNCVQCDFYKMVKSEEENTSRGFAATPVGMKIYQSLNAKN